MDFGASCGSALAVVPASLLGELRLSKVLLRGVYCVAGCGGAFARRRPYAHADEHIGENALIHVRGPGADG